MSKQSLRFYSSVIRSNVTGSIKETRPSSVNLDRKWNLFSAVCLERHPVITKPMTDIEKQFQEYILRLERDRSFKNDFELRKESEIRNDELIKKGLAEVDLDKPIEKTALDIEEAGIKELQDFPFSPRETEADKNNVTTSLDRKLYKNLLLLVEQNIGKDTFWIPPQGLRNDGETLRQTAERVLLESCGSGLTVRFYGNAPIGVYKYLYPKKVQEKQNADGAKIFYFLAKYVDGSVQEKVKYQWLDRTEIKQLLPKDIHKSLSYFLIPE